MSYQITGVEKETVILFNEAEKTAQIATYNGRWKRRLNELCKSEPETFQCTSPEDKDGYAVYTCNKKRLSLPHRKREITEEQRKQCAERMKAYRNRKIKE